MKKLILMVALIAVCGVVQADHDPVQKGDATQKSAIQKGEAEVTYGFFGRVRGRRAARIEARRARWFGSACR